MFGVGNQQVAQVNFDQSGAGGVDIDLSPYFGYNKDYLSYPLTATSGDTIYVFAQAVSGTVSTSASLTWEEQV